MPPLTDNQFEMIMAGQQRIEDRLEAHIKSSEEYREALAVLLSQNLGTRVTSLESTRSRAAGIYSAIGAVFGSAGTIAAFQAFLR